MDVSVFNALIESVGFSGFIAIYLLVRLEPTIKDLQKSNQALAIVLAKAIGIDYNEAQRMAGLKTKC